MVTGMLRFGTDGVRGRVGVELDEKHVARLGAAVALAFRGRDIVVGNDGRESGEAWSTAFGAGAVAHGAKVALAGVVPTPAIAHAAKLRSCVGVSITASHNPWYDNGVKVFAPGGRKLTDDEQQDIEDLWQKAADVSPLAIGLRRDERCAGEYVESVTSGLGHVQLGGLSVIFDAANGATSRVVGPVAETLGLRAEVRHATPNGRNINDGCGAVHPEGLAKLCAERMQIGIAFDGDGDRVIAVDELGNVIDGDRLIALMALDLRARGSLTRDTVVVTSMTNLGFHRAMQRHGVSVVTTDVGDRAVLSAMESGGYVLGGEQSGHIINFHHATTGDGLLAAVLLLQIVRQSGKQLAELAAAVMQRMPQILRSVRVANKPADVEALLGDDLVRERAALGDDGRIVVRASGTEPVVRIMVEAPTTEIAVGTVDRLERLIIARA